MEWTEYYLIFCAFLLFVCAVYIRRQQDKIDKLSLILVMKDIQKAKGKYE